jgi:hypothetical protein
LGYLKVLISVGLEQLKDVAVQCRVQKRIVDRTRSHLLKHTAVLLHLVSLEALNCYLPVVDRNEVHKLAEVLDVDVCLLNLRLKLENVLLFAGLCLEEALQGQVTDRDVFQLSLVFSSLGLLRDLFLHHELAAFNRINHTLDIKHFTLDPQSCFQERRFVSSDRIFDFLLHITTLSIC